eukprot:207450_1
MFFFFRKTVSSSVKIMAADPQQNESNINNRYYNEPLFAGNLSMKSNGINNNPHFYRWILFLSTSNTDIVPPKTIKQVEYKFKNGSEVIKEPPFFLESGSMGIFQLYIIITFKHNYIRSMMEVPYILSLNSPTTLIDITSTSTRVYIDKLFNYKKFGAYKYEEAQNTKANQTSFVKHIGSSLTKNLLRTPAPLRLKGYSMKLDEFKPMLQSVINSINELNKLSIPSNIYDIIGFFTVFHSFYPVTDLVQKQRCVIMDCNNCDIKISAPKFNHLLVKSCNNITIEFPYIFSQCELHQCSNIKIICKNILYSYRLDECKNVNIEFNDIQQRITFLCFETTNIILKANNIKYYRPNIEDDEQQVDKTLYSDKQKYPDTKIYDVYNDQIVKESRLNVRWRSSADEAKFTTKNLIQFKQLEVIGFNVVIIMSVFNNGHICF